MAVIVLEPYYYDKAPDEGPYGYVTDEYSTYESVHKSVINYQPLRSLRDFFQRTH